MMTIQTTEDVRIAVRLPRWLYDDVQKCAERSGWDLSKQVRHELATIRGKGLTPYFPARPTHDRTTPKRG